MNVLLISGGNNYWPIHKLDPTLNQWVEKINLHL